jgi:UPF0042 nucleotide-binding protein
MTARPAAGETASVVLVTGLSGAGKSSALNALEDLGYEAVDNLPLSLLASVAEPRGARGGALALGADIRTRDFDVARFIGEIEALRRKPGLAVTLLFLDSDDEVLSRRFTETRRRHPLASDRPVADGIRLERERLEALRHAADLVIDTSQLKLADLKHALAERFAPGRGAGLSVFVTSFSYRRGLPREADLVFDVRFLANPHYEERLKDLDGRHPEVAAFIAADSAYRPFFDSLAGMLIGLLPAYEREGKAYLTIAIGCTGGRHRSVFVAERLTEAIAASGWRVSARHRDLAA